MSDDKNLRENEQPENKRTQRSAPLESEALEPRILLSATWVDADDGADEVDVPDGSEGLEGDELVVEEGAGDDLLDDGGDDLLGDVPVEEEAPAISASIGDRVEVPLVHDAGPMPDWLESTNPGIEDDALAMESGQTVTLTWEGESAGYQSTLGYYIYDDAGNITDVDVLWPNASSEGSGGDLVVGESQVEFEVAAGDNVGFFNIANGFSDADNRAVFEGDDGGQYEFRDAGGDPATRDSAAPSLVFVDAEGAETTLEGNIYHSTADGENVQLNPDEMTHVRSGAGPAGEMHIHLGFEDLYGGGDEDYDDLNFSLTFTPQETASGYELDIDLSGAGDPETLSAVTLGGLPDGASLSAGTDNGDGTWTIQQSELEGLAVLMDGPADFELSLSVNSADGDEVTNSSETVAIDMSPWDGDVADGDLFVHDGGVDSPVVDLTDYSSDDVTFEYGRMTVELPDGGSFTVEFQDVDSVEFSDGSVGLFVWDAGADDADSSSALNWQNDQTPGPNDILIFHGDVDVSAEIDAGSVGGILVGDGYSGRIILEQPTEIGQLDLGSGRLEAGSHDLTVHGDIHVDGGQLNAQDLVAEGDLVVTSGDLDVDRLQLAGDADQVLQPGTEYLENVTVEKTGGTLTLSGPIELRGDFTHVSGAVDAGDSTVEVRGGSLTLATGDIAFNDFVFDNGSTVTIQGELLVDGDLTVERVRYLNGGEIHVGGDVTTTDTSVYGSSVFVLDGSGDQTIDAAGGMGELSAVTIDKPDGTLTFTDHVQLSGDFTHVAGEVVTTGATIEIQGGNLTIDAGTVAFDDLVLNNGSRITVEGELVVEGDLTIERVRYLNGGEVHVAGDVTTKDTSVYGSSVFVLDGSGDQTIDAAGGMGELSAVTIDKPDGTLTFTDHVQLSGDFTHVAGEVVTTDATIEIQGGNLTVAAGDVTFDDLVLNNGSRVTIDGELTVEGDLTIERAHYLSGGELHVAGDVTTKDTSVYGDAVFVLDGSGDQTIDAAGGMGELSAVTIDKPDGTLTFTDHVQLSGDFTHVAGDVVTTGATIEIQGGNLTVAAGDVTFDDLVLNNGSRVTIDGELTVEGDLTIERAHYLSGGELHVAGDVTTKDTSVYGDAVLVLDGSGDQTIDAAGGMGELSAVTIDKPDGTLTFTDHVQLSGDFTHVAGEVVTTGATIEIQGGNLTVAAGDVTFDDLVLNNGSRVTIDGELTVEGDLTIERAHYLSGGELHVAGDVTTKDTSVYGDSVLVLDGSGDQTIDAAGGMGELSAVTIDKPDGTLTFTDHVQLSGDFTHVAGEVVTTGSTVEIQGGNVTIAAGDVAFDDLVLENGSRVTLDGDLVVDGDLTIERAHYLNGGDLRVAGDVTGLDSSVYGDSGLVLTGDSAVVDVAGSFDTIRFEDVTPDAVYTITGSGGWDTLDLSEYSRDEVGDDGSSLVVDMGGDESFTVNYTSVEEILINDPPVVEAGVDQTVDEGALVTLDGAASDAEGDELTYTWVQTGGPTVVLSDVHAQTPTFEAPDQLANTELTFELEVSDGRTERSDSVTVTVQADDDAPMAEAGPAQTVEEGEVVTLTGSGTDPEGEGLTFTWVQTGGPAVELDDPSAASPTFTAPDELANTDVVFQLQVSDGTQASLDTVTVTVNADDDAPSADAGPPQLVTEGDVVALSGSGSDPEGQDLVFEWVQTGGPEVTLDDATAAAPVFEAPEGVTAEELTFELHVTDGETTTVDTVAILVEADDDPPTAQAGAPAEAVGGDVVRLEGTGSDPEGRDLTYSWVQIGGAPVELDDPAAASPSFHVPDDAGMDGEPIRFELTVSDGESASVDAVDIVVTPNPVAVAQPEPEPQPEVESEPENVDSSPETGAGALAGAPTSSPDGSSVDEDGLPGTRAEIYDELFLDQDSGDAEARELGDVEDAPSLLPASDSDAAAQRPNMSALFREVVDFGSEGRADVGTPIQLPTQLGEGDFTSLFAEVGVVDSALQAEAEEASREDGSGDASNREARPEVSEVDREEAGTERNERKAGGFFAGLFSLVRGVAGSSTSSNRSSSEDEKK